LKAAVMPISPIVFLKMDWNGAIRKLEAAKESRTEAHKI
jgi:hypothetical protein